MPKSAFFDARRHCLARGVHASEWARAHQPPGPNEDARRARLRTDAPGSFPPGASAPIAQGWSRAALAPLACSAAAVSRGSPVGGTYKVPLGTIHPSEMMNVLFCSVNSARFKSARQALRRPVSVWAGGAGSKAECPRGSFQVQWRSTRPLGGMLPRGGAAGQLSWAPIWYLVNAPKMPSS